MTPLSSTGQNTVRTYFTTSTTRTHTYSSQWNQLQQGSLPFLDTLVTIEPDNTFSTTVCRKPTQHRSVSTLEQQPPHHCQTKCLQHPGTQGQNSIFYTGQNGQGTPTHKNSTTTLSVSSMGPQPVGTQIHSDPNQPNTTTMQTTTTTIHQPTDKKNITIVVPYMPNTRERFRKLCKKKGIQVHFKGTNTRTALGNPHGQGPQKPIKQES